MQKSVEQKASPPQAVQAKPQRSWWKAVAVLALIALGASTAGWSWLTTREPAMPVSIISGNGRIEAEHVNISAKSPGRVVEILVEEGALVTQGTILARIETAELEAQARKAQSEIRRAEQTLIEAEASVRHYESEVLLAEQQLSRTTQLAAKGYSAKQTLDQKISAKTSADSALSAAKAKIAQAKEGIGTARAERERIDTEIADATLKAPRTGRIEYRVAEPGEVVGSGGTVVTLLDVSNVYMTVFLPTRLVGKLLIGTEARILLDAFPDLAIPARVTFVAAKAQFTPKEVETKSEREKLMFRVKVTVDPELVKKNIEKVRTGLPGVAYIKLDSETPWPAKLQSRLTQ